MSSFDSELAARLAQIREQGLFRELRHVDSPQSPHLQVQGRPLLNFSSNDYLGLANHPRLKEAATKAIKDFGAGSGASRLICGSLAPHHDLENAIASFKGVEAAITFSSGYAAAVGAICSVMNKDDVIILDKLVHASIVDAARLCGAKMRVFAHNDPKELENILQWAITRATELPGSPRSLVVTESVFSMDGDIAPLREIVALKKKYDTWLMVDEAHATGVFGPNRRGIAEEFGVSDEIDIHMGTLGKALGASGGYICGSKILIEYLVNRARSFIFSTAPTPATAASAQAGIELVQSPEGATLNKQLWRVIDDARTRLASQGWPLPLARSPIIPLPIGAENQAMTVAQKLRDEGILLPAIRYPTVAKGEARLRLTLSAAHTTDDVAKLCDALAKVSPQHA